MTDDKKGAMPVPAALDEARAGANVYFKPFIEVFKGCGPVLELAFGHGHFLEMLREAGIECTGLELNSGLCEAARLRNLNVLNKDLFVFLRESDAEAYNGCFASHIVEHLPPAQVDEMVSLVHKVLKPGGKFIIITPNIHNIMRSSGNFWHNPDHLRPYPLKALLTLLKRPEWEVIDSGELFSKPLSLKRRIAYRLKNALIGRFWVGDDIYVVAKKKG